MKLELLGVYGNDETHANAAWTSSTRGLTDERRARIAAFLRQLAQATPNPHLSPFRKSKLHFLCDVDTAVHIHLLKHRFGVEINGESARYHVRDERRFHLPTDWPEEERVKLQAWCLDAYDRYLACLERLLKAGYSKRRARESARYYLPYATELTVDIDFTFEAFVHFVRLRGAEDAQLEDQQLARAMLALVREYGAFPASLAAFDL